MVTANYQEIIRRIQKTCIESGRPAGSVSLVVVSKTQPAGAIRELYDLGVRDFGENRVQELLDKKDLLPADIRWHLIGSLQTNKVKYIADFIHLIHSADRPDLLAEIDKQGKKIDRVIPVLLQVRVASEETKHGCLPTELPGLVRFAAGLTNIEVKGTMTMASFTDDKEQIRDEFLRFFSVIPDSIRNRPDSLFSTGMTSDFEEAIRSGSNLVRIGSAIFGERSAPV